MGAVVVTAVTGLVGAMTGVLDRGGLLVVMAVLAVGAVVLDALARRRRRRELQWDPAERRRIRHHATTRGVRPYESSPYETPPSVRVTGLGGGGGG